MLPEPPVQNTTLLSNGERQRLATILRQQPVSERTKDAYLPDIANVFAGRERHQRACRF